MLNCYAKVERRGQGETDGISHSLGRFIWILTLPMTLHSLRSPRKDRLAKLSIPITSDSMTLGHSYEIQLREADGASPTLLRYHTASWLKDLHLGTGIGNTLSLSTLRMLGTHDSATHDITPSSPYVPGTGYHKSPADKVTRKIVAEWSKAQSHGVCEQLTAGVRYLDIRAAHIVKEESPHLVKGSSPDGSHKPSPSASTFLEFRVPHGMLSVSLQEVVEDVIRFFTPPADSADRLGSGTELEIVVFDLQHLVAAQVPQRGVVVPLDVIHMELVKFLEPLRPHLLCLPQHSRPQPPTEAAMQEVGAFPSPSPPAQPSSSSDCPSLSELICGPISKIWKVKAKSEGNDGPSPTRGTVILLYPEEKFCHSCPSPILAGCLHPRSTNIRNPFFDSSSLEQLERSFDTHLDKCRSRVKDKFQNHSRPRIAKRKTHQETWSPLTVLAQWWKSPLFVTQAQMTPGTGTIVGSVFARPFQSSKDRGSLLNFAKASNSKMLSKWAQYNVEMKKKWEVELPRCLHVHLAKREDAPPSNGGAANDDPLPTDEDDFYHDSIVEAASHLLSHDSSHCNILLLDFYEIGTWTPFERHKGSSVTGHVLPPLNAVRTCIELNLPLEKRFPELL
jgi:hypothetical protein